MSLSVSLSLSYWPEIFFSEDASELGKMGLDEEVPIKSAGDFNPMETSEGIRTLDLRNGSTTDWDLRFDDAKTPDKQVCILVNT